MDKLIPDSLLDELLKPKHRQGAKGWLSPSGKVRLMFLKHYTGLSDEALVEQLNFSLNYQWFCHLDLCDGEFIKDKTLVTRVRKELSLKGWGNLQIIFQKYWKGEHTIAELQTILMDATCYESYIRYPTDAKLLWESCQWVYDSIVDLSKQLGIVRPRNKFLDQQRKYDSYARSKKKTYQQTKQRKRSLLYLLNKLIEQLQAIFNKHKISSMGDKFYQKLNTIKLVLQQQKYLFDKADSSLPDRIVSLAKPFIRPIVRGKEVKRVEFGAKVHLTLTGGIAFIEHLSFNAFHEGIRLQRTVLKHEKTFQTKVKMLGGDKLYANNKNRKYVSQKGITTNFAKKGGKQTDQEKQAQKLIHNARASQMESDRRCGSLWQS